VGDAEGDQLAHPITSRRSLRSGSNELPSASGRAR
jgi:hypothetical protein